MDINTALNLVQQALPAKYGHVALEVVGVLSIAKEAVPRLVVWGVPAAGRSADWLAKAALNSPLRPLILWQAPNIISFLDSLSSALTLIMNTFKTQLEADIKAAIPQSPTPVTPNEKAS